MHSSDKYGKLKKQIDRYFLPLQINSQFVLEAIKLEDRKNQSPAKIKQETISKLNEQMNRFELLKVTGRQLNSNFVPISLSTPKPRSFPTYKKNTPQKQHSLNQIRDILNQPLDKIVNTFNRDPQLNFLTQQLQQFSRINRLTNSQVDLKTVKYTDNADYYDNKQATTTYKLDQSQKQRLQKLIISNPNVYKKMIYAFYQETKKNDNNNNQKMMPVKKMSLAEGLISKKFTSTYANKFKQNAFEKNLSPIQLKKHYSFIKYREFLLTINISNKIIIYPEDYAQYKAFICKGNNGILVKSILKSRPWWCLRSQSDIENCSLIWSEWKKVKLTQQLPTRRQNIQLHRNTFYTTISTRSPTKNKSETRESNQEADDNSMIKRRKDFDQKIKNMEIKKKKLAMIFGSKGNLLLERFIQEDDSSMFTFTRKINQKNFEEISKKYITQSVHNYRSQTYSNGRKTSSASVKSRNTPLKILNHLPGCLQLHSKKLLFLNLKKYYEKKDLNVFDYVPETYVITKNSQQDPVYQQFLQSWNKHQQLKAANKTKNVWICKPGQNSNRGYGITVASTLDQIKNLIKNKNVSTKRTLLIQRYIEYPLLYNKRKFDIRCFLLFTSVNGYLKAYWYNQGYIRTASKQFTLKCLDNKYIHLTNDAIQKKSEQYGKFQNCNKISFGEFEKYLSTIGEDSAQFSQACQKMRQISQALVNSCAHKLNPLYKQYCFEVFGLDFMIDNNFKPYIIQANSNPCLQVDGSVLSKIIPAMIENVIKIAIDPIFPPPYGQVPKNSRFSPINSFETNKFELIYDSSADAEYLEKIQDLDEGIEEQEEEDQQFQNNNQQ